MRESVQNAFVLIIVVTILAVALSAGPALAEQPYLVGGDRIKGGGRGEAAFIAGTMLDMSGGMSGGAGGPSVVGGGTENAMPETWFPRSPFVGTWVSEYEPSRKVSE